MTNAIRLDAYISRLLYDAESGYYARNIEDLGAGGDFSTSVTLSPLLARGIASWIAGNFPGMAIIECGAGNGMLASQLTEEFAHSGLARPDYHIVESSPALRLKQQKANPSGVSWHETPASALAAVGGRAVIIHNELVDAFPARQFRVANNRAEEHWVEPGPAPRTLWRPIAPDELPDSTLWFRPWHDGQVLEVQESYRQWLLGWASAWKSGAMICVDYGETADQLYTRFPQGTLRGYYRHERLEGEDVFLRPGLQDITCDVNFSDLRRWGDKLGWQEMLYATQAEFLSPFAADCDADRHIIHPLGAGTAFKVLIQSPPGESSRN